MSKFGKKFAALVAAGALVSTPAAFAAQDTSGMRYTSASEGFYASIRARFNSNQQKKESGATIGNSGSRFGVRGSNDLGGGLEGFYQYEASVGINNGSGLSTRLGYVGLRGGFGDVRLGGFWPNAYNWTNASTDVANVGSANITPTHAQYRTSNTIQYTTPDLNGFQGAIAARADDKDAVGAQGPALNSNQPGGPKEAGEHLVGDGKDDSGVDLLALSAKYGVGGISMGAAYYVAYDALTKTTSTTTGSGASAVTTYESEAQDGTSWVVSMGYSQDNWYVNGWYSEDNASDGGADNTVADGEKFSIAAGVSVDKVNLYALHDTSETGTKLNREDTSYTTLGAQYNLGSRTRVWVEYNGTEQDAEPNEEDRFNVGLRHDF